MHMADALLSPEVGLSLWAISAVGVAIAGSKLQQKPTQIVTLMAVLGAFVFSAQMVNFSIPGTGSSGHLGGGLLLAILLGPWASLIVIASVLFVQAFIFADGGILALGSNIFNMGIIPCLLVYTFIYKPLSKYINNRNNLCQFSTSQKILIGVSAVISLQFGAFAVVGQTFLSQISALPFSTFLWFMLPIHLCIGIIEGFITIVLILFIVKHRPDIIDSLNNSVASNKTSFDFSKILIVLFASSLIIGGGLSYFSSENPDGLEWSIAKVIENNKINVTEAKIYQARPKIQEKTVLMPDYVQQKSADTLLPIPVSFTIAIAGVL